VEVFFFFGYSCHAILGQKLHDWPNVGQMYKQTVADGENEKDSENY